MGPRWPRTLRRHFGAARLPAWAGVALIGAGFALLALFVPPGDGGRPELPPEFAAEPDVYLEEGDITQFRADGSLHYRLRAERVSYFLRDEITELDAPTLELHSTSAPPWRLAAATGEVRTVPRQGDAVEGGNDGSEGATEEEVTLRGEVLLRRKTAGGFTEVSTEQLVLYPERQFARADKPVMIATPARRATAAGLRADLRSGRMTLVSSTHQRVAVVVDPPSRGS